MVVDSWLRRVFGEPPKAAAAKAEFRFRSAVIRVEVRITEVVDESVAAA